MRSPPSFERAEQALEDAFDALPLAAAEGIDVELRHEYVALVLYILQTRERLALLQGIWAAKNLPQAPSEPAPMTRRHQRPKRAGTA